MYSVGSRVLLQPIEGKHTLVDIMKINVRVADEGEDGHCSLVLRPVETSDLTSITLKDFLKLKPFLVIRGK